jgi:hypothetical protein
VCRHSGYRRAPSSSVMVAKKSRGPDKDPGPVDPSGFPYAGVHFPCYLSNAQEGKGTVGEQFFDDLARGLDDGTISRRRALRLGGGAVLAAIVPSLFPREAEARHRCNARCRCRRRKSRYLSHGECHCALTCSTTAANPPCHGNDSCICGESVEGSGFCFLPGAVGKACSATSECPTGAVCVRIRGCPESGGSCTASTDCPSGNACLNGRCQRTFCFAPCPT